MLSLIPELPEETWATTSDAASSTVEADGDRKERFAVHSLFLRMKGPIWFILQVRVRIGRTELGLPAPSGEACRYEGPRPALVQDGGLRQPGEDGGASGQEGRGMKKGLTPRRAPTAHSTVTLLARFRGLSTSQPRRSAM